MIELSSFQVSVIHLTYLCLSQSSGSGNESGIRTQNSFSEGSEKSANNNGCNSGEDNGSYGLNNGDDGSGTQVQVLIFFE